MGSQAAWLKGRHQHFADLPNLFSADLEQMHPSGFGFSGLNTLGRMGRLFEYFHLICN
jgi:hypothetical protein